jgi:hypothetical protein
MDMATAEAQETIHIAPRRFLAASRDNHRMSDARLEQDRRLNYSFSQPDDLS